MRVITVIFALALCAPVWGQGTTQPATQPTSQPTAALSSASPEGVAHIQWSVTREVNVQEYRVLRGEQPGGPWELIETIEGQGRGVHGARQYHVRDVGLEVGRRYHYLIEHGMIDGTSLSTGPVGYVATREASPEIAAEP